MLKSELLEREAEARRAQLAQTFDELRARVTPGHVLDRLVDYATDAGGQHAARRGRTTGDGDGCAPTSLVHASAPETRWAMRQRRLATALGTPRVEPPRRPAPSERPRGRPRMRRSKPRLSGAK